MKKFLFLTLIFLFFAFSCSNGGGTGDDDNSFTVGYNSNGAEFGVAPVAQKGNGNISLSVSANTGSLLKNGYLFDGWNTASDGSGIDYAPGSLYSGKDITLYAKWTAIFDYNIVNPSSLVQLLDGIQRVSGNPTAIITGLTDRGRQLSSLNIPESIDGYTVAHIATNAFQNCNKLSDVIIPNTVSNIGDNAFAGCSRLSDITLLGATPPAIGIGILDNCFAIISVPQNAVVTYQGAPGWDTYSTSIVYIGASTYCLVYDGNGSDGGKVPMMRVSAVGGYPIIVDGNTDGLTRAGCTFNGWNTAPDGSGNAKNAGDTIQLMGGRITLYAQWYHPDWVVTFDSQEADKDANPSTIKVVAPANTIELPTPPIKDGYSFAGWYSERNGQGNQVTTSTVIYGNTAVYAKWNEGSFQITYNANGADKGTVPSAQKGITNNSVTIFDNTGNLSKVGYTFKGWNTRSDGTGEPFVVGASYSGPKDITLYAQWNYNVYNILIDDISNGVISLNATEDIAPGTVITLKMTPARGYKLNSLTVTKARGGSVVLSGTGSTLIFSMPDDNVIVRATFTLLYTSTPGNRVSVNVGDIVLADGNTVTAANYSINANAYTALDGVPVGVIAYEGNSTTGGTTAQGGGIGLWYIVQIDYDDTKLRWTGNMKGVGYGEQPRLLCNSSGSYSGYYNTYSIAAKWSDYSVNKYPAFAKAINYHAPGTIESNKYYSDWFLPTCKELQRLIRGVDENGNTLTTESNANLAKINSSISVLAKAGVSEANAISTQYYYWSSSQSGRGYASEAVQVSTTSGILCPYDFVQHQILAEKSVPEAVVVIRALD